MSRIILLFSLLPLLTLVSAQTWYNDGSPNDCARVFGPSGGGMAENIPANTHLCRLRVNATSSGTITYRVENNPYISVQLESGNVTIKSPIDREFLAKEGATSIELKFSAQQGSDPEIVVTYTVSITDVNDNVPEFQSLPYTFTVSESSPPGTVVYANGIVVKDADQFGNAEISVNCVPPFGSAICNIFRLTTAKVRDGEYASTITLGAKVDYEATPDYIMLVLARDNGVPSLNKTVNVLIVVTDSQDEPPRFRNTPITFTVLENTTVSSVGIVEARDGDGGDGLGRPLVIDIYNDAESLFSIGSTLNPLPGTNYYRAQLTLNSSNLLDREAAYGGSYRFNVSATEIIDGVRSNITTIQEVYIIIQDINDNEPVFLSGSYYNISIPENMSNNTQVPGLSIVVRDNDGTSTHNQMRVSILSSTHNAYQVTPTRVVSQASLDLLVKNSVFLDYEVPSHRENTVVILAVEDTPTPKFSASATVHILLTDVNDHSPKFSNSSLRIEVSENRPVGWKLSGTLKAIDGDASAMFGTLTYSLVGTSASKLTVNSSTGELFLAEKLDYETEKSFSLNAIATDGGGLSDTTLVHIVVLDYNDNQPVFTQDRYRATIQEESTSIIPPLIVKAIDADSSSVMKYSIISGNTPDLAFRILNGSKNGQLLTSRGFNYNETLAAPRGKFILTVMAEDGGTPPMSSTSIIEITIEDINNNAPIFNPKNYSASIRETEPSGSPIVTVTATDADFEETTNKRIRYSFQGGNVDKFLINERTGEISVKTTNSFDIDVEGSLFFLQIMASDEGSPILTDIAAVYVTVRDANNKNPVFSQSLYIFTINETIPLDSVVGSVKATDADSTSSLQFAINPSSIIAKNPSDVLVTSRSPFDYLAALSINSTSGEITSKLAFQRDVVAELQLQVVVTDTRAENPPVQTATATVIVKIAQSSVATPVFNPPWTRAIPQILVSIPEEQPVGSPVINLVATDPITKEKVTNYIIVPGSDAEAAFTIDGSLGLVRLQKVLDFDGRPVSRFSCVVQATTSSGASSHCTLIVALTDKNDNSPQFLQNSYSFFVDERTIYPREIGLVTARDADSGDFGTIRYTLRGPGSELFQLDSILGVLRPAPGVILDREAKSDYNFLKLYDLSID